MISAVAVVRIRAVGDNLSFIHISELRITRSPAMEKSVVPEPSVT